MLLLPTLLFVVYILSTYLFDRFKIALGVISLGTGFTLLLNDWDSSIVSDSITKLVFILSFVMYIIMVIYNISIEKEN